jgi:hypothetical protein
MGENETNFKQWYKNILESLYKNRDAGFILLIITFPLLERYLREKSGIYQGKLNDNNDKFYCELLNLFRELNDKNNAKSFWDAYRNGLLHQVTISLKNNNNMIPPKWKISHDTNKVLYQDPNGDFFIQPVEFTKNVIKVIENDFPTFEGKHSNDHPLPRIKQEGPTILSTSADRCP